MIQPAIQLIYIRCFDFILKISKQCVTVKSKQIKKEVPCWNFLFICFDFLITLQQLIEQPVQIRKNDFLFSCGIQLLRQ